MDIKCKNCGQMISEDDKFCRYCGYLVPEKPVEPDLSKKQLDDLAQEMKATISAEEMEYAGLYDLSDVRVKYVGEKKNIYIKNVVVTLAMFVLAIAMFAIAFVGKYVEMNKTVALVVLTLGMFFTLGAFGVAVERFMNTRAINSLKEDSITVKKYGFKKPAEFLMDGHIFEVEPKSSCPECQGEVIGDLHIEKIEKVPVIVCNINRKHYWILDETNLIQKVKSGEITVEKKAK